MNDNQAGSELIYRPRWLAPLLAQAISEHPVIILTGARQVGKSTLLQHEKPFSDWLQINLDSLDVLEQAEKDPASLWIGAKEVIIDEVQRVPRLLYEVKQAVDKARHEVRFVLSGSANLLLMRQVSETLAGRAVYFLLTPISLGEVSRKQPPEWFFRVFDGKMPAQKVFGKMVSRNVPNLILRGFMPPLLYLKRPEAWVKWWEGYVATYVERDLRQISQIDSLTDFRRVMAILALRSGQVLNQTEVARDSGVSQSTVRRYINLLEVSCLLERLPAFYSSRTKRLIKSPKIFCLDPGLSSFLMGYHDVKSVSSARELGALFETLVFLHLKILGQLATPQLKFYYWRTVTGKEVDFIIEWGRKIVAVEVKLTSTPRYEDTANLRLFLDEYPNTAFCLLIHNGTTTRIFHKKILAIPWQALASAPPL